MLSKKSSFRVICNVALVVCLVLGFFGTASAESERYSSPQLDLGCAFSDMTCQWEQMNARLRELNRSVGTYNRRIHNQDDASACNADTILPLANASADGQVQIAIRSQCQQDEVPASSALWLLALSLVGFVITSTKRNI